MQRHPQSADEAEDADEPSGLGLPNLSITVGHRDGHLLLVMRGSADLESKEHLAEYFRTAIDQSGSVVIDLQDLDFMDSSGLSALVGAANRAHGFGETITVRHPRPVVLQAMRMSGVDQVVTIELDGTGD
jgi:anti-anti-sigma factor